MKKLILVLVAFALLATSCKKEKNTRPQEIIPEVTDGEQVGPGEQGEEGELTLYKVVGDEITKVKDYKVKDAYKSFQDDKAKHQKMWAFVTRLIPLKERENIGEFVVFHGEGQLLGYVTPVNNNDLSKWRFGLAIDVAQNLENINLRDEFTYTSIHEYGHVLTLNDKQIDVGDEESCDTYFVGEGCSKEKAYIKKLFDLGWKDLNLEGDPYDRYDNYASRFVTEYAATNPAEDIAEVFTNFVILQDKPTGNTIADQKIKLLYDYPELRKLRMNIRANSDQKSLARLAQEDIISPYTFRRCGHKGCSK